MSISSPLLFPSLSTEVTFPAPNPRPRVLRNVTIKDMRIKPGGNAFLASGTVQALIVLPQAFDVSLDVLFILPEVLVFDGEVPFVAYEHKLRDGRRHQPPGWPRVVCLLIQTVKTTAQHILFQRRWRTCL